MSKSTSESTSASSPQTDPPTYTSAPKAMPSTGGSGQSPWDASGFAFAPNTNAMDPVSMPSAEAQAARAKAAEVMAKLKAGDAAGADREMGKAAPRESSGIMGLRILGGKLKGMGGKKKEAKEGDGVVR